MIISRVFLAVLFAVSAIFADATAMQFDTNFEGTWRGTLHKIDPEIASNALPDISKAPESIEYAIEISTSAVRVYVAWDDVWTEVKPGAFGFVSHKTNAVVAATDSHFSKDGRSGWVETWNITLTAKDDDALYAYWVRAVNNPHLSDGAHSDAKFFMSRMGTLQRSNPIVAGNALQVAAPSSEAECPLPGPVCGITGENAGDEPKANRKIKQQD